jgi:hypothetical protein
MVIEEPGERNTRGFSYGFQFGFWNLENNKHKNGQNNNKWCSS